MKKVNFTKMVASGNDFVVIDSYPTHAKAWVPRVTSHQSLAKNICDRIYGVGADGLLVLEKSLPTEQAGKIADIRMRIFNSDGSEAEMCGNGARCVAFYSVKVSKRQSVKDKIKIETRAGVIEARVNGDNVKIKLTDPKNIKLGIPLKINNRLLKVNFVNTGVPHTVIFVEGLDKIDVQNLGRVIRYHKRFSPQGTNVNFVEVLSNNSIKVRTYERGVEDETLACGTGSVASALITARQSTRAPEHQKINVHTQGGEVLKVYFDKINNGFKNVWLEGKAMIVFKGEYYV